MNLSRAKLIGAGVGLALLHYAIFTVSYVHSEVVHAGPHPSQGWQAASEVLAFPLGYLVNVPLPVDLFPVAIVVNSLLWGAAGTAAIIGLLRVVRGATKSYRDRR
jgi:hypothetical protein